MPSLGKTWQILMKGVGEVNTASNPKAAAEMVLIRLAYAANLPDPAQLIKKLKSEKDSDSESSETGSSLPPPNGGNVGAQLKSIRGNRGNVAQVQTQTHIDVHEQNNQHNEIACHTLHDIVQVLEENNALVLASHVYEHVQLVSLKNGTLEFCPAETAPASLANDLAKKLSDFTGKRWMITLASQGGAPTLSAQAAKAKQDDIDAVMALPQIKELLAVFPDAELIDIIEPAKETNEKEAPND
jgi:DNA polymerase-3 subunit gamma/tau